MHKLTDEEFRAAVDIMAAAPIILGLVDRMMPRVEAEKCAVEHHERLTQEWLRHQWNMTAALIELRDAGYTITPPPDRVEEYIARQKAAALKLGLEGVLWGLNYAERRKSQRRKE